MKATLLVILGTCFAAFTRALVLNKEYPVTKVVKLLEEMKAQLEKEADADEEIYDKIACWCETNDKVKTKAIADSEARIAALTNSILSLTASSEALKVEIESLQKEIEANEKALATATAIREKAAEEFNEEEKEMIQSIKALDAAIIVLSKHHQGAALAEVKATINAQFKKHSDLLLGIITPSQKRAIMSFTQQQGSDYFDSQPIGSEAYAAQSGTIYGILTQMKETFESDLAQDQKDELAAQNSFKELKEAKELEISTGKSVLESKVQLLATQTQTIAQQKEDRDDTSATLSADEKYLMDLKQKCSMTDQEWEERQRTRQDEVTAITQAIAMLTTDDARDLFGRTFNPVANASFFQEGRSLNNRVARDRAADTLQAMAISHNSPKLSALAAAVRLDAFTKVKKAIDDMVSELAAEKAAEITLRDYCIDELAKKDRGTQAKTHEKGVAEQKIESLRAKIEAVRGEIDELNAAIADLNAQLSAAEKIREAEAATFASVTADQAATQELLAKAIKTLSDLYKPDSFLQHHRNGAANVTIPGASTTAYTPSPEGFSTYKMQGGANPVIALLNHILNNVVNMEKEVRAAEAQAVGEYSEFKQATSESIQAKEISIINKRAVIAKTEQDKVEANRELDDIVAALGVLADEITALHTQCDYTLKNFDARQQARDEEVEALRQAKAFLEGMRV